MNQNCVWKFALRFWSWHDYVNLCVQRLHIKDWHFFIESTYDILKFGFLVLYPLVSWAWCDIHWVFWGVFRAWGLWQELLYDVTIHRKNLIFTSEAPWYCHIQQCLFCNCISCVSLLWPCLLGSTPAWSAECKGCRHGTSIACVRLSLHCTQCWWNEDLICKFYGNSIAVLYATMYSHMTENWQKISYNFTMLSYCDGIIFVCESLNVVHNCFTHMEDILQLKCFHLFFP